MDNEENKPPNPEPPPPDWVKDLPKDCFMEVLRKVSCGCGLRSLALTSKPWRSTIGDVGYNFAFLAYINVRETITEECLICGGNIVHQHHLPLGDKRLVGSSKGSILIAIDGFNILAINLLFGRQFTLPELPFEGSENGKELVQDFYIRKVIMCEQVDCYSFCIVCHCDGIKSIKVFQERRAAWVTVLDNTEVCDILCEKNLLSALTADFSILQYGLMPGGQNVLLRRSSIDVNQPGRVLTASERRSWYLARIADQFFIVAKLQAMRRRADDNETRTAALQTQELIIFISDYNKWSKVESIGDEILYIGLCESKSVKHLRAFRHWEPNHIFFLEDHALNNISDQIFGDERFQVHAGKFCVTTKVINFIRTLKQVEGALFYIPCF